jgi:3-mercaptopyruvate sulfurtransferase SseA
VALLLKKSGITRIRPLLGGLEAWRERGYPLDTVTITEQSTTTIKITTK